ncbi:MAG TPA: hypothetical protein VHR27_04825 [Blastocatellia bacterium]|nr:hypothetical protein [Blastocatellia bacterium]
MLVRVLLALVLAGGGAIVASVVMDWASRRSPFWNMIFGAVLALALIAGVILIAILLASAAYPY